MADYVPVGNPNAPNTVSLADLVQTYNTETGKQFPTRWQNIADLIAPLVTTEWGNIPQTPTIDNQKDLLALVSLRI